MTDMTVDIEGKFNINVTPVSLIQFCFSGTLAVLCVFGIDSGTLFGHGYFDLSDFALDAPVDDTVTWTATIKLNGLFTAGS
jgi:hypothetical protein